MTIKTFSITSDLDSVEFTPAAPVCFIWGNESDCVLDLVRELIGNNPYSTPDLIDDGSFVIHADVEMDGKNYALCYLRNADFVGDCRIAANFESNSKKFSVDDTEEYLRKISERNNDYSNVFDGAAQKMDDKLMSESDRILAAFEKFIVQCENTSDDRPVFIYNLFYRLDESIDVRPYLDKLSALGRQVFVSVCNSHPEVCCKDTQMINVNLLFI